MLRVGLTGGVACGKSSIGEMFARHGVQLLRADELAHSLMRPGTPVYQEIVRRFGRDILHPEGTISRPKLAELAFGGGRGVSRIQELNAIVHPAVLARQDGWMREIAVTDEAGIAMVEAALILEAGARDHFEKLIVVTCRPEQKAERYAQRMNLDLESARREVQRRSAAQWPDEKKIAAADYVIDNSGTPADAEKQVERVLAELKTLAGTPG